MGNICRSPSAQGVFEKLLESRDLIHQFEVDSAGTHSYHIGSKPDIRSIRFAQLRGIDLSQQKARKVKQADFINFDYILAMDTENFFNLNKICPSEYRSKIYKMMRFAPNTGFLEVPDPYYGGDKGFNIVLDLLEQASVGLLEYLNSNIL
jgi:protein-tyrosine phosphatase